MKKLEELGISPAPWEVIPYTLCGDICFANGETMFMRDKGIEPPKIADARIIAAAPKLYAKAYEIAENLRIHLAVPTQSITLNRAEVEAMAKELEDVLSEAAGEREV